MCFNFSDSAEAVNTERTMMSPSYQSLVEKLQRANTLGSVVGLMSWDEQVNLPSGSGKRRAEQMAILAELHHNLATDASIEPLLQELESMELTSDEQSVVRPARKEYDRLTKLPAAFVTEKAVLESQAYHAWAEAREKSDFTHFAPYLEKQLKMANQEAAFLGYEQNAYDYHIDRHDPGMTSAAIEGLFSELKKDLIPLVRQILDSPINAQTDFLKNFPVERQKSFLKEVTARLGFDYTRGRIDVSLHPFCAGDAADTRMTTRFHEDNPLDSLFSSIHETGHGLYEQGLPVEALGTALGEAVGMGIHESQSRLWENQVARGKAFWKYHEPKLRESFPSQLEGVTSDDLYLAMNAVTLNPIRVDSDEVTYNLHIILRFELEKLLFSGEMTVADLPNAWKVLSNEIIGVTPKNDAEGVLQDVHWSGGAFGYFPSYCLGNMIGAQLWYTALEALPNLEDDFAQGDFSRLLKWLRSNIHCHGKRYDTGELVKKVTGAEISPAHLIRYLKERYLPLYSG
jgi:carboxypeptidase Taq